MTLVRDISQRWVACPLRECWGPVRGGIPREGRHARCGMQGGQCEGESKRGVAMPAAGCRGQWEKVGDVVGGPGEGSGDTLGTAGKWHGGRQWDYVVDVDFADGVAPKKLAFDRSDNPYSIAERCVRVHGMPRACMAGNSCQCEDQRHRHHRGLP